LAELRWILLGLGTLAIGAIWWWSARRSAQAPGNAELRESTVMPLPTPAAVEMPQAEKRAPTAGPSRVGEARAASADTRTAAVEARASPVERASTVERAEWSISPLEPLSIRTADFEDVPDVELPVLVHPDPLDITQDLGAVRAGPDPSGSKSAGPAVPSAAPAMQPGGAAHIPTLASTSGVLPPRQRPSPGPESSDRLDAVAPANSSERQKIVTLRVCAVGETRWPGAALISTLEQHGLAYGRYQVYHRKHVDGRSIFCVASLIEPGSFDAARMANDQFRGVSMFAVLPGPLEPLQTVDALFATARELARELSGTVQDAKGIPFSPQRVAALREDVARFQAQLG
jgi:cell division protein ZipA